MDYQSDYITHHGVKGMKWGIRKAKVVVAGVRSRLKPKVDERKGPEINKTLGAPQVKKMSSKKANKLSAQREKEWRKVYNSRHKMTSDELQSALKRLNLENQFAQSVKTAQELTAPGPTSRQKAAGYINSMASAGVLVTKIAPVVIDSLPSASPQLKQASNQMKNANKILNAMNVGNKKKD